MHSPEIDPLPTGRVCSQPARESTGRPWRLCVLLCHIPTPSLGQVAWLHSLACLPAPETGYGRDSDSHFEGKGAQFPSCDSCQAISPFPGCERPVLATVSHIPFHYFILFYFIFYFSKCLKLSWAKTSKAPSQVILRVRRVPSWAPKTFAWEARGARVRLPLWVYVSPNRQHYSEVL